jgi:hypothetical protein
MTYLSKMKLDDASQRAYSALFWYTIVQFLNVLYAADDELNVALISYTTTTSYVTYGLSYLLPLIAFLIAYFFPPSQVRFSTSYKYGGSFCAAIYMLLNAFEAYWSVNSAAFNAVPTLLPFFLAIIFNGVIATKPDIAKLIFFAYDETFRAKDLASDALGNAIDKESMKQYVRDLLTERYTVSADDKVKTIQKCIDPIFKTQIDDDLKRLLNTLYGGLKENEKTTIKGDISVFSDSVPESTITFDPADIPAAFELIRTMLPNLEPYSENNPTYTELKTKVVTPIQEIIDLVFQYDQDAPLEIPEDDFEKVRLCMPQIIDALADEGHKTWFSDSLPNPPQGYLPLFMCPKATIEQKYLEYLSSYIESILRKDNPSRLKGFVPNEVSKQSFATLYSKYKDLFKDIPTVKLKDLSGTEIDKLKTAINQFTIAVNANLAELAKKKINELPEGSRLKDLDASKINDLTLECYDGTKDNPFKQGLYAYMAKFDPMKLHIDMLKAGNLSLPDRIKIFIDASKQQNPSKELQDAITSAKALLITELSKLASLTPKFDEGVDSEDTENLAMFKKIKDLITKGTEGAKYFLNLEPLIDRAIMWFTPSSNTYQMLQHGKTLETFDPASLVKYIKTYDVAYKLYKPTGKTSPDAPPVYDIILSAAQAKINTALDNLANLWPECDSAGALTPPSMAERDHLATLAPLLNDHKVGEHFKGKKTVIDSAFARFTDQSTLDALKAAAILAVETTSLPDLLTNYYVVKAVSNDKLPKRENVLQPANAQIAAKLKELVEANPKFTDVDATMKTTIEEVIAAMTEGEFELHKKALNERRNLFDTVSEHYKYAKAQHQAANQLTVASKSSNYHDHVAAIEAAYDALNAKKPDIFDESGFKAIVDALNLPEAINTARSRFSTFVKSVKAPTSFDNYDAIEKLLKFVTRITEKNFDSQASDERVFADDSPEVKHLHSLQAKYFEAFNSLKVSDASADIAGLNTLLASVPPNCTVMELQNDPLTKDVAEEIITKYSTIVADTIEEYQNLYTMDVSGITETQYNQYYDGFWENVTNFEKYADEELERKDSKKPGKGKFQPI